MKLENAIETLTRYEKDYLVRTEEDFDGSVRLGVEALKRIKDMRSSPCCTADELLPGETESLTILTIVKEVIEDMRELSLNTLEVEIVRQIRSWRDELPEPETIDAGDAAKLASEIAIQVVGTEGVRIVGPLEVHRALHEGWED